MLLKILNINLFLMIFVSFSLIARHDEDRLDKSKAFIITTKNGQPVVTKNGQPVVAKKKPLS